MIKVIDLIKYERLSNTANTVLIQMGLKANEEMALAQYDMSSIMLDY